MPLSPFGAELLKLSGPALEQLKRTVSKPKSWGQIRAGLAEGRKKAENVRAMIKNNAARKNFTVAQSRKGRRSMSVDTMLKKEKEGALYKFTKAAMDAAGVEVVNGKKRVLSDEEAQAVARQAQEIPIRTLNQIGRALPAINEAIPDPTEMMGMMPKMGEHKDKIPGGLADKKSPKDFKPSELKRGVEVELEHTNDKNMAKEIAMDHLQEHPEYYKHLKRMEKKLEKTGEGTAEKYLPWYGAAAGGTGGALLGEQVVPRRLRGVGMVGGALIGTGIGLHSAEALGRAIDGSQEKSAWAKLASTAGLPTQFLNVNYTAGENRSRNMPVVNKPRGGDAPTVDQSSRFGVSRGGPEWQNPESAIGPKLAALGRMIVSPTETHPSRGEGIGPKRIGGEEQLLHIVGSSPDPEPITAVEADSVYSRA